jgi:hypothetical protein
MGSKTFSNFQLGEISVDVQGRVDLDSEKGLFSSSLAYMKNSIATAQGPFKRRTGSKYLKGVRGLTSKGRTVPFVFNDEQAYGLLFSPNKLRFEKDREIITESTQNITDITQASEAVVTISGHGYSDGDEVYIKDVEGMTEVNGGYYLVSDKTANTFKIKDLDGSYIDSSGYTAYSSGGTAERVYEIDTPYDEDDIFEIDYSQNADVMYITGGGWNQRKLTRVSDTEWTLKTFEITESPFHESAQSITDITQASEAVVTISGHGYSDGDRVIFYDVGGMTEVNDREYEVSDKTTDTFKIKCVCTGDYVDSSGYTAYTSGGSSQKVKTDDLPSKVHITSEKRIAYAGTTNDPDKYFLSRSPEDDGTLRYDDFTVNSPVVASDAITGFLPTVKGKVDTVKWIDSTKKFLTMGTFATVYKIYGPTEADAIAADDTINVKPISNYGCLGAKPAFLGETLFFIQRNGLRVRALNYALLQDDYGTDDKTVVANRIADSGLVHIAASEGDTDILWGVRDDGVLTGLSYQGPNEEISGWHRHDTQGEIIDVASIPQSSGYDVIHLVVKRTIDGTDKYYREYLTDEVLFKTKEDFYDPDDSDWPDYYDNYKWEANKNVILVDSALTYDGSDQSVSLTIADDGDGTVTVTASGDVFESGHVGREIWIKYSDDGQSGGSRLEITAVNSATEVECDIRGRYPTPDYTATTAAGDWYLTAGSVSRLEHLEGKEVQVVVDGAFHKTATVSGGSISLDSGTQGSVIHVGLRYISMGKTNNLNIVEYLQGNGHTKTKNVTKVDLDVVDSGVFKVGTDLTHLETVLIGTAKRMGYVTLPATNIREQYIKDDSARNKHIYIVQDAPYPLIVRGIEVYANAS